MADSAQCGMDKKWVRDQLTTKGQQAALAKHLRVSESLMSKMLSDNYKRELRDKEADKIRDFFRPDKRASRYANVHGDSTVQEADASITVPDVTEKTLEIPVYRTWVGPSGAGGDFTMSLSEVVLSVRRPAKLADRTDIYGLYVVGDTMSPRYEDGELILVESGPPPKKNDHVVVRMKPDEDGRCHAYLKQLLRRVGATIELKQYNPERVTTLDACDVDAIHRVMTTHDLVNK